ncbi:MAG: metallophosphoesterase [Lactovum sp.]
MKKDFNKQKNQRLAIISDFHLDSNHFSDLDYQLFNHFLEEEKVTDLHFAGDISNDFQNLTAPFFQTLSEKYKVSYNLGNHDMLNLTEDEINDKDFFIKDLGQKRIIACHGWYDYSFYEQNHSKILHFKNNFYFDRKIHRTLTDKEITDQILWRLEDILKNEKKEILLILHFVPHSSFIIKTRYEKFSRFNAFLGSQRFHELFIRYPQIKEVIFGHIHQRYSPQLIDGILYHAKPLGYTYEWQILQDFFLAFPELKISHSQQIRKQYNAIKKSPEWLNFRQENLKKEFKLASHFIDF